MVVAPKSVDGREHLAKGGRVCKAVVGGKLGEFLSCSHALCVGASLDAPASRIHLLTYPTLGAGAPLRIPTQGELVKEPPNCQNQDFQD